jgi:hypothetical protein
MKWLFPLISLLLMSTTCLAQAKVFISATADDNVGSRLVYSVKEKIRASQNMELVLLQENAAYSVVIVTMDPTTPEMGYSTIYSVVFTIKAIDSEIQYYWSSNVGTCGSQVIDGCAEGIVAALDKVIENYLQLLMNNVNSKP